MKILVAGAFHYSMYQEALCHGLEENGQSVIRLVLAEGRPYNILLCSRNEKLLLDTVRVEHPDAIFLYRVESIWARCLKTIKILFPKTSIAIYHNDDPFRKDWKRFIKSIHYLACVKNADITYVYRPVNIDEAYRKGARVAKLFMSHYYTLKDFKELSPESFEKRTDEVAFVGHFEKDSRIEIVDYLFKKKLNLHIYGSDWKAPFKAYGWPIERLHPGVSGNEYWETIHRLGIALAFFSEKNRDEYTRRCFEIPIMGTLIAAPLTSITNTLFKDGVNALLFTSKEELYQKIDYYMKHPSERNMAAMQGYFCIKEGDNSEISRAKMVVEDLNECKKGN